MTPSVGQVVVRTGVGVAMIGAALVHGSLVTEHFAEWGPAGAFFLATQAVEVSLAVATLDAWGRRTAQLVVGTCVGTMLVWLLSRTLGMPIGPASFRVREAVGRPDLACAVLELAAAVLATPAALAVRPPRALRPPPRSAPVLGGVLAVVLLGVSWWGLRPG